MPTSRSEPAELAFLTERRPCIPSLPPLRYHLEGTWSANNQKHALRPLTCHCFLFTCFRLISPDPYYDLCLHVCVAILFEISHRNPTGTIVTQSWMNAEPEQSIHSCPPASSNLCLCLCLSLSLSVSLSHTHTHTHRLDRNFISYTTLGKLKKNHPTCCKGIG